VGCFVPSANSVNITVTCIFSLPDVFMAADLALIINGVIGFCSRMHWHFIDNALKCDGKLLAK
jgi:hypothetical protein